MPESVENRVTARPIDPDRPAQRRAQYRNPAGAEFAQLTKHRGARTGKGHYFGPFASAGAVNRTINVLQRAFLLRTCSDSYYANRTRPCLLYQIKRCAAPCTCLLYTSPSPRD